MVLHESTEAVQEAIASAMNDEARELNECIRDARVRAGLVDDRRTTTGSDGLSIGRGEVIQTRHSDSDVRVANRQTWIAQAVGSDGIVWAMEQGSGCKRQRTVRLSVEYVAEHTHLPYASTAYGVQGATAPGSHTALSDALDASGVYVGMTRGQETNRLHVVAHVAKLRKRGQRERCGLSRSANRGAPAFAIVSAKLAGVVGGFFLAFAARMNDSTTP